MASTNKTANLSLNQWTLDDPFLMEDFNADNRKLDAAMTGMDGRKAEFVKLKELVTTTGGIKQIELDVSDIRFLDWQFVYLDININTTCLVKINNPEASSWYRSLDYTQTQYGAIAKISGYIRMTFNPSMGTVAPISALSIGGGNLCYGYSGLGYGHLATLNFVVESSSSTIDKGTKFTFWGVR